MPHRYIDKLPAQGISIRNGGRKTYRVVYRYTDDYKVTYWCVYYGKFVELERMADGFALRMGG